MHINRTDRTGFVMKKYYTYAYLREDGTPYYIGKGSKSRARKRNRNDVKLGNNKMIILKYFELEFDAYKHEMYMINLYGRKDNGTGILHNRTDGGDGVSNRVISENHRTILQETGKIAVLNKTGIHGMSEDEKRKSRLKGSQASKISCARKFKVQYKDGTIYEGTNVTEFCRDRGISQGNFTTMLKGRQKSAYGYRLC